MNLKAIGEVVVKGENGKIVRCRTLDDVNHTLREFLRQEVPIKTIGMQIEEPDLSCLVRIELTAENAHFFLKGNATASPSVPGLTSPEDDMTTTLKINEAWSDIFLLVKEMNRQTAVWMAGISNIEAKNGELSLVCRSRRHVEALSNPEHADILVGAIRVVTGLDVSIVVQFDAPTEVQAS